MLNTGGKNLRVRIESLAFGGAGIAKEEGKVFFVDGGLPDDVLDIKIIKDRGSFAEAVIEEIVEPSAKRVEARCPVFEKCGGCQLQNLEYGAQLTEKENIFRETLKRIGGFEGISIEPIRASSEQYGYRNRVTLSAFFYSGRWNIGYNQKKSNRKVRIEGCPVSDSRVEAAIGRLSKVLSSIGDPAYSLEKIHISSNGQRAYITLVASRGRRADTLKVLIKHLKRYGETENVSVLGDRECEFEYESSGSGYLSRPSVFTQANYDINTAMVDTVLEWAGIDGSDRVLDLYAGTGNFSIPLSMRAHSVDAVEVNRSAVNLAKRSAELNKISNIVSYNSPCEAFIEEIDRDRSKYDLVVLDPPREGAKEAVSGIAGLSPARIIYVSCDPATLARDLKNFSDLGYELAKVRTFDMFPQTYHIESVSLLLRV
jgi:23S rRNA (uracil1939-C5)-methyltransferase